MARLIKFVLIRLGIILFTVAVMISLANSVNADVIELRELSLNYKNYGILSPNSRNLLIYPESPKEGIDLGLNIDLLFGFMYSDATVESLTTSSQYRGVGLKERLGFNLMDDLQIGYAHHSQHVLDKEIQSIGKYPSEDAIELRFIIYRGNK